MKLTKVNIVGKRYVHFFEKDDKSENLEVECTKEDYAALALPNPVNPSRTGYRWIWSAEKLKFDTPSGDIENGQYAEYPLVIVKTAGFFENNIEAQHVVNDEIEDDKLSKLVQLEQKKEKVPLVREKLNI